MTPILEAWQRKSAYVHFGTTTTKFSPNHSEAIMRSKTRTTTFLTGFYNPLLYSALTKMLIPWEGKKKSLYECFSTNKHLKGNVK